MGGIRKVLGAAETVAALTEDASSRALELQASAEEVAKSTDHLFQSVEKTSSSTGQMDASTREMSQRTDVLAGIGDEVLSFVAEMDATIGDLRGSAQADAEISSQVREDAQAGGRAVAKIVEGIHLSRDLANSTATTFDDLHRSVGQITLITKRDNPALMSKRISLADDGNLNSDGSECRMTTGTAALAATA